MTSLVDKVRELVGLPTPTMVVTLDGVDHDPTPISLATACGQWLQAGYTTNPPQGTPCPACFGDPS